MKIFLLNIKKHNWHKIILNLIILLFELLKWENSFGKELILHGKFQIVLYKKNEIYAMELIREIDKINEEVQGVFKLKWLEETPIVIELVDVDNEIEVIGKDYKNLPYWVAGYASPSDNRIVIRYKNIGSYPYLNLRSVLKHELSHIFLYRICKVNNVSVPKWFDEGLAMYVEKKWDLQDYYQASIRSIILQPIPLEKLRFYFPTEEQEAKIAYVESFSFINYLMHKNGDDFLNEVINRLIKGEDFEKIILTLTKKTIEENERDWHNAIFKYYKWIPIVASTGFLWIIITLFTFFFYWKKRKKDQLIVKKWQEEEYGN